MPVVYYFKAMLARHYEPTYRGLLAKIVGGPLAHADETEVHLKDRGKGYVWVLTNLEEVFFLYRPTREGDFLHELLRGFRGVLAKASSYVTLLALPWPCCSVRDRPAREGQGAKGGVRSLLDRRDGYTTGSQSARKVTAHPARAVSVRFPTMSR
jgi:hypothetical protein